MAIPYQTDPIGLPWLLMFQSILSSGLLTEGNGFPNWMAIKICLRYSNLCLSLQFSHSHSLSSNWTVWGASSNGQSPRSTSSRHPGSMHLSLSQCLAFVIFLVFIGTPSLRHILDFSTGFCAGLAPTHFIWYYIALHAMWIGDTSTLCDLRVLIPCIICRAYDYTKPSCLHSEYRRQSFLFKDVQHIAAIDFSVNDFCRYKSFQMDVVRT